jgi:hypothetical protein
VAVERLERAIIKPKLMRGGERSRRGDFKRHLRNRIHF